MESASRPLWVPIVSVLALALCLAAPATADTIEVAGSSGQTGISLRSQASGGIEIHYEMGSYSVESLAINGDTYQQILLPQVLLHNDAGAPDLPGMGRYVAMPQGSVPVLEIVSATTQVVRGIDVAPAPVPQFENDDSPLVYEKNQAIYSRDAMFPDSPAQLSEPRRLRGVDVVTVGITPFQYNPVTKELIIYTEIDVRVDFQGGNGQFGEERLRSRYWEPILTNNLLNYESLPEIDFNRAGAGNRSGYEYVIITPDDPDFIAWSDTLKTWRMLEGISTEVFTTTDIGGSSSEAIEAWLDNAYLTWDPAPDAFLIMGDYPDSGDRTVGITSPIYDDYCVSDNIYADVDGDHLPEMVHGRIVARNATELETMIGKMLSYERAPYTDPDFYDRPVFAGGWQEERWFILCTEICLGHQLHVLGKNPVREYAIYQGIPGQIWSSHSNTGTLINYFGPSGLGYIPLTPEHLTDWGANASRINSDLNSGAFMMLHRDHGYEGGWGEPNYGISHLFGLNGDMYPFVFSVNCLTGKYNYGTACFSEVFHRLEHGSLGMVVASEVSYSFVNDTLVFGIFDGMWPEFMPDYGPHEPYSRFATNLRTAFGLANGKYFLDASSWPGGGGKTTTFHLFHHFGDAFMRIYSEVPEHLAVTHPEYCYIGDDTFTVQADEGAVIALTVDGEIIGVADATGAAQEVAIVPQIVPGTLRVTITKDNCYRYDVSVPINPEGAYVMINNCEVIDTAGDNDGVLDACETVDLVITLDNVGPLPTTGLSATIASADPHANITTATQGYPDLPGGAGSVGNAPFVVAVTGDTPDGHVIEFTLTATASEGQWEWGFDLPVEAPLLIAGAIGIDDTGPSGNSNGRPDAGETVLLTFGLENIGHSPTIELVGTLSSAHPDVVIHDAAGEGPAMPIGSAGTIETFSVEFLPSCPMMEVQLQLAVTAANGLDTSVDYGLQVGPWFDDCETDLGWTLGAPDDDATTGLWIRDDPVGTEQYGQPAQPEDDHTLDPGHICFVTGNTTAGQVALQGDVDDGKTTLLSPYFDLSTATAVNLSYWRWYTNDLWSAPNSDWWDVDVTADGDSWVHLEHTTDSANWWSEYSFDIGSYVAFTDSVQFRFVASDYGLGSLVEALVDDIVVDIVYQAAAGLPAVDVDAVRAANGIVSCSPNPFNPNTTIVYRVGQRTPAVFKIYDVNGRIVRNLLEEVVEAGEHAIIFDGRNSAGQPLASGIYFLRMQTPEIVQVRQVTLLK